MPLLRRPRFHQPLAALVRSEGGTKQRDLCSPFRSRLLAGREGTSPVVRREDSLFEQTSKPGGGRHAGLFLLQFPAELLLLLDCLEGRRCEASVGCLSSRGPLLLHIIEHIAVRFAIRIYQSAAF